MATNDKEKFDDDFWTKHLGDLVDNLDLNSPQTGEEDTSTTKNAAKDYSKEPWFERLRARMLEVMAAFSDNEADVNYKLYLQNVEKIQNTFNTISQLKNPDQPPGFFPLTASPEMNHYFQINAEKIKSGEMDGLYDVIASLVRQNRKEEALTLIVMTAMVTTRVRGLENLQFFLEVQINQQRLMQAFISQAQSATSALLQAYNGLIAKYTEEDGAKNG